MKKIELLCPVGGKDTLSAAILGGADAVYFGGKEFNARMNAKNFDREAIQEAVLRCHDHGVRTYITLNTLFLDRRLQEGLDFVSFLYKAGCDALIVADLGFAALCKQNFPDFPLHGSTQISGHNAEAAKFLAEKGFSRMVCAREIDKENLTLLCKNSPIPIEAFVHGAICASASGQCLMSSMIGDRSGNRGECAQPCRLPYNNSYPLSFKDLSLARHAKEVFRSGVSSLKIEGRMKSPEYVYSAAKVWRTLIDEGRDATEKELECLASIFSRSGFTSGYFEKKLTDNMLGRRTENDKKKSADAKTRFVPCQRTVSPIEIQRGKRALSPIILPQKEKPQYRRSARFYSPEQIPEGDFFIEKYLPLEKFDGKRANGVILPPVIFDGEEEKVRKLLEKARLDGAEHAIVGNIGHVTLLDGLGFRLHGDFRLNVTNSFSLGLYPEFEDIILSPELTGPQIRDLRGKKTVIVYGRIPLMLLEKNLAAKNLRDRRGVIFPVLREGGRSIVINSVPIYMADRKKEMKEKGMFSQHFLFTTETKKQVEEIIFSYQKGLPSKEAARRIR